MIRTLMLRPENAIRSSTSIRDPAPGPRKDISGNFFATSARMVVNPNAVAFQPQRSSYTPPLAINLNSMEFFRT
ncbi:hypothetical protein CEXT_169001 [Caerostris extrusa]|uniref:Uncharacterized protein n=1 Tax=Caerostris extrusa TaxID=172846 RepID=A0AAV4MW34_CAEEX|nr:hypothetical protein CEXT_169001 [Caerostris extrusa]